MSVFLLLTLTFVNVTLGLTAGYYFLSEILYKHKHQVSDRLKEEFRKETGPAPKSALFKNLDRLQLEPGLKVDPDPLNAEAPPPPKRQTLALRLTILLERSGLKLTLNQLLIVTVGMGLVLGLAGTAFRGVLLGLPLAIVGAALPFAWVFVTFRARKEKMLTQLPAAFDLMARVVRAGQSIPQAFQAVADSFEDPIATEFAHVQRQQNLGLSPETTLRDMANRCDILEMRIFVMAMLIQRQTGGNLAEVLERLSGLLRDRLRLRRQVRTLTAEGRLQGWTLFCLPFIVFGALMVVNRRYAEVLFNHVPLLVATGVSMLIGMLWIRKIVNFKP